MSGKLVLMSILGVQMTQKFLFSDLPRIFQFLLKEARVVVLERPASVPMTTAGSVVLQVVILFISSCLCCIHVCNIAKYYFTLNTTDIYNFSPNFKHEM